jgi:hypothetical protein
MLIMLIMLIMRTQQVALAIILIIHTINLGTTNIRNTIIIHRLLSLLRRPMQIIITVIRDIILPRDIRLQLNIKQQQRRLHFRQQHLQLRQTLQHLLTRIKSSLHLITLYHRQILMTTRLVNNSSAKLCDYLALSSFLLYFHFFFFGERVMFVLV